MMSARSSIRSSSTVRCTAAGAGASARRCLKTASTTSGQLLTGSYLNYGMPRAADFPFFKGRQPRHRLHSQPARRKGVGEVGAIGVPPAVINAIVDALSPLGVQDISMPATPEKIWRAIQTARASAGAKPKASREGRAQHA